MNKIIAAICFVLLVSTCTLAQVDPLKATGDNASAVAPFGTYDHGQFDSIDLGSGAVNLKLPIASLTARNHTNRFGFFYSSKFWSLTGVVSGTGSTTKFSVATNSNSPASPSCTTAGCVYGAGWNDSRWRVTYQPSSVKCFSGGRLIKTYLVRTNYVFSDEEGGKHGFPSWFKSTAGTTAGCMGNANTLSYATDASGIRLDVSGSPQVTFPDGSNPFGDTNGNTWSHTTAANGQTYLQLMLDATHTSQLNQVNVLDQAGNWQPYTVTYGGKSITTSFSNPFPTGVTASIVTINSINLPNGKSYVFEYNGPVGELTKVSLPTGGYIRYDYQRILKAAYSTDGGNADADFVSHRYVSPDGTAASEQTWTYSYSRSNPSNPSSPLTTTVTKPDGTYEVHNFVRTIDEPYRETSVEFHEANGTLKQTVATTWACDDVPEVTTAYAGTGPEDPGFMDAFQHTPVGNCRKTSVTTILDNGLQAKRSSTFDVFSYTDPVHLTTVNTTYGNEVQVDETAYGQGAPGSVLRTTKTKFQYQQDSNYLNAYMLRQVYANWVGTPSNTLSLRKILYDTTTPTGIHGNPSVFMNAVLAGTTTNPTAPNPSDPSTIPVSSWLSTTFAYDAFGNAISIADPGGHTTTYSYGQCNSGSLSSATHAITSLVESFTWFCNIGKLATKTDFNSNTTSFDYSDPLLRRKSVSLADSGQTTFVYDDTNLQMATTTKQTSTANLVSTSVYDKLARTKQTIMADPAGAVYVDTTYDTLDRASSSSNPYRTTSDPTYGTTTTSYDALDRATSVVRPDNSTSLTAYTGNCVTTTDEAGKSRKTCSNAIGQVTQVFEDPSGSNFETDYQYDVLGNLVCVEQHGNVTSTGCSSDPSNDATSQWRVRRFAYDSVSHLLTAQNPESGTVSYTYDADSNVATKISPAPNQSGALTVTTIYSYDAMHRLIGKTYSNSDPSVTYGFDETVSNSLTITNGKGRRTSMSDASGQTAWSYDVMGRALKERRTIAGITKELAYTYNFDGSVNTLAYPSGAVITFGYDSAAHLLSAVDSANNVNYVSSASYAPIGTIASATIGNSGTFSGYTISNSYNNRLQPTLLSANKPGGTILSRFYTYGLSQHNNGLISIITDNLIADRSVSYGYDQLNRIVTAQSSGTDCSAVPGNGLITQNWGNSYTVDAWGNLAGKSVTKCSSESLSTTVGVNNQLGVGTHDAAGNLMNNGSATYTYDAENRIASTAGVSYVYDGDGVRVKKSGGSSSPTLYWGESFTAGPIAETDLSGTLKAEYVYFGGKRIARRDLPSGAVHYYFSDHLNSTNLVYSASGTLEEDSDFYPYGGERGYTLGSGNHFKFTGKERDPESGLDYFGARYYGNSMGRFTSADPLNVPNLRYLKPTAFSKFIGNPQNWNAYSYSHNDPVNKLDPNGYLTVIVPGTWNDHGDWDNSQFKKKVEKSFGEKAVVLENNNMGDSDQARAAAAKQLQKLIADHKFAPGEKLNIVTHSHGGNVVAQATQQGLSHKVDTLVTLGVPVRDDYKFNQSAIGTHLNVYSNNDNVQPLGGERKFINTPEGAVGTLIGAGRTVTGATNLNATAQAKGHSDLWQSPGTWDKVVTPALKK